MQRRDFLKSFGAATGALFLRPGSDFAAQGAASAEVQPDPGVRRVLAMFKCHLDVGFTNTQSAVVHRYFDEYFPQAIRTASELRQSGKRHYVWTTGSWLLYEYLEQAQPADRKRMEQAIADQDIAWHALPFSWQTELLDPSMISGSLGLSDALDRRFGKKTTGAKMTDVPGHTRGLVSPLAAHGVTFLDIGVNGASRVAEVPPLFVWKEPANASLVVMYHHGYGSTLRVPDSDLAVSIVVRNDNGGPHTPEEIRTIHSGLKQQFPNAEIAPASLSDIASAVLPYRERLPVVTGEIGDSWIYGVSSDPLKLARYREVMRLRRGWLAQGRFKVGDATDVRLLRRLLLAAEHTWGTDTKRWLDYDHYKPGDLAEVLTRTNYKVVEYSWEEKRQDLLEAVETLPPELRDQAQGAIRKLEPKEPALEAASHPPQQDIETAHFVLAFDNAGAIRRLRSKASGREWASPDHRLALFSYQTLSESDYSPFFENYIISHADWVAKDFGKPDMEKSGAATRVWQPSLGAIRREETADLDRVLAELRIHGEDALRSGCAAYPARMFLELVLPKSEPLIRLNFYWFGKPATRLPEALWLSFRPPGASADDWTLEKCGQEISPHEVVPSGGRMMHAVERLRCRNGGQELSIEPLDAPLVALGEMSPLNFSRSQPDLSGGIHSSLFNNAWGTNYLQWFGEDMGFRYILRA